MRTLLYDIETDSLGVETCKFHCGVIYEMETQRVWTYRPGEQWAMAEMLNSADLTVTHNGIDFDNRVMRRFGFTAPDWHIDTHVLSRVMYSNLMEMDLGKYRKGLASFALGSHSLEAWGHRLGVKKAEYTGGWEQFTEEMLTYCRQDVTVLVRLYSHLRKNMGGMPKAYAVEADMARYLGDARRGGALVDKAGLELLIASMEAERAQIQIELREAFGSWWKPVGQPKVAKRDNQRLGYHAGAERQPIELVEFNLNSRDHLRKVLEDRGFTLGETMDAEAIRALPDFPEREKMLRAYDLTKFLGMLAHGAKAWYQLLDENDRLHPKIWHIGTVTHRGSHSTPNIGQVPRRSELGLECRKLFVAPPGWRLGGSDAKGLELRMLGQALYPFDGGKYAEWVVEGDVHSEHLKIASQYITDRDDMKTWFYAWLYGAGAEKRGRIVTKMQGEKYAAKNKRIGRAVEKLFLSQITGLSDLKTAIKSALMKRNGYLKMPDGRPVMCRSEHSALNTLLQTWGALVCKYWAVNFLDQMTEAYGPGIGAAYAQPDAPWQFAWWVHDEIEWYFNPAVVDETRVQEMLDSAMEHARKELGFQVPLGCDYKSGLNWYDVH